MGLFRRNKDDKGLLSKPRAHHYIFAHQAVREFCFHDPLQFFKIMSSEHQRDYLEHIWKSVVDCLPGEKPDFGIEDIVMTGYKINNHPSIIIKMPQPKAVAEAYFVCIILKGNKQNTIDEIMPIVKYYTLELSIDLWDGTLKTMFCHWAQDGTHGNMGYGPAPDLEKFIDEIKRINP